MSHPFPTVRRDRKRLSRWRERQDVCFRRMRLLNFCTEHVLTRIRSFSGLLVLAKIPLFFGMHRVVPILGNLQPLYPARPNDQRRTTMTTKTTTIALPRPSLQPFFIFPHWWQLRRVHENDETLLIVRDLDRMSFLRQKYFSTLEFQKSEISKK